MSLLFNRNDLLDVPPLVSEEQLSRYSSQLQPLFIFNVAAEVDEVLCDKCPRFPTSFIRMPEGETYPWMYELQCSNLTCEKRWYMCKNCPPRNFRSSSSKPTRVNHKNNRRKQIVEEHHNSYHVSDDTNNGDTNQDVHEDTYFDAVDFAVDIMQHDAGIEVSIPPGGESRQRRETRVFIDASFRHLNVNGMEYFLNEFKERDTGLLSVISSSLADSSDPFTVSKEDAVLHLMFTRQFLRATRDECFHNVDILARLNKRYQEDVEEINEKHESQVNSLCEYISHLESMLASHGMVDGVPSYTSLASLEEANLQRPLQRLRSIRRLAIPTTPNDCRKYIEGKNCVLSKIPCPNIKVLDDGYAYVSVKEVVTLVLAMGILTPLNTQSMNVQSSRSYFNNPAFTELMTQHEIPEVEFRNCLVISEWTDGVETASGKTNRGSMKVTTLTIECPINRTPHHTFVVAAGKSKSDQNRYRVHLYEELKNLTQLNSYYDGKAESVLQYRLLHYSTVADRPEISEATGIGNHNALYCSVPSTCFPVVVAIPHPDRKVHVKVRRVLASCEVCYEERLLKFPRLWEGALSSKDCDVCDDWDPNNVEWKIVSPDFPSAKIPQGGYHTTETITFGKMRHACSTAFVEFLSGEWSPKQFGEYLKVFQFSTVLVNELIEKMNEEEVHEFDESFLPAKMRCTSTIELYQHLPGIMHLIFLGLGKTMLGVLQDLMKTAMKYSPFHDAGNAYLQRIRSLSIAFCKAWNFGSKKTPSGPWVAENCLGYVRVMKGLYSIIAGILPDTDPNKERVRIAQKCIWSFVAFVSRVMQDEYTPELIDETECILKLFLSEFETMDKYVRKPTKKPTAEKTGNVMYLLRLPQLMRDFGPLREFWEGSIRGEGIFRFLKPLIRRGIHNPGACRSLLQKYFCDKFITWILEKAKSLPTDEDDDAENDVGEHGPERQYLHLSKRYSDVNTHPNRRKLEERLENNLPLSLVEFNSKLYAKYRIDNHTTKLAHVSIDTDSTSRLNGNDVLSLRLVEDGDIDLPSDLSAFEPCLGCPVFADGDRVPQGFYYVVSSSWKEMDLKGKWLLPTLYRDAYQLVEETEH